MIIFLQIGFNALVCIVEHELFLFLIFFFSSRIVKSIYISFELNFLRTMKPTKLDKSSLNPSNFEDTKEEFRNQMDSKETSRICVKNIPQHATEERLIEYFSKLPSQYHAGGSNDDGSKVIITDVKILKTKEGKSRKMAFIGFKRTLHAEKAVQAFHRAYFDTSRLIVEKAFSSSDKKKGNGNVESDVSRPWSRHSKPTAGLPQCLK